MSNALDLSSADASGFDAIPSASYNCVVFKIEAIEIEKEDGKLPKGTAGYNVQFKVDGGEFDNRRVWNRYYLPGTDYAPSEPEKRARMLGMFVRFLTAIGYAEKEVKGGKFKFDPEDAEGRKCTVVVGQQEYNGQMNNTVKNVKPIGENLTAAGLI